VRRGLCPPFPCSQPTCFPINLDDPPEVLNGKGGQAAKACRSFFLELGDVCRFRTLGAVDNIKADRLALGQGLESLILDGSIMNKDVTAVLFPFAITLTPPRTKMESRPCQKKAATPFRVLRHFNNTSETSVIMMAQNREKVKTFSTQSRGRSLLAGAVLSRGPGSGIV